MEETRNKLNSRIHDALARQIRSGDVRRSHSRWIKLFLDEHGEKDPRTISLADREVFLKRQLDCMPSATDRLVACHAAVDAIRFLYREVVTLDPAVAAILRNSPLAIRRRGSARGTTVGTKTETTRRPRIPNRDAIADVFVQLCGRTQLFVGLLYGAAMNASEVAALRLADVRPHRGTLTVRKSGKSKGTARRGRIIPIPRSLIRPFQRHIEHRTRAFAIEQTRTGKTTPSPFAFARKDTEIRRGAGNELVFQPSPSGRGECTTAEIIIEAIRDSVCCACERVQSMSNGPISLDAFSAASILHMIEDNTDPRIIQRLFDQPRGGCPESGGDSADECAGVVDDPGDAMSHAGGKSSAARSSKSRLKEQLRTTIDMSSFVSPLDRILGFSETNHDVDSSSSSLATERRRPALMLAGMWDMDDLKFARKDDNARGRNAIRIPHNPGAAIVEVLVQRARERKRRRMHGGASAATETRSRTGRSGAPDPGVNAGAGNGTRAG